MIVPPTGTQPNPIESLERLLQAPAFSAIPADLAVHSKAVPLGVMVRGVMEWLIDEPTLERLYRHHAPEHYTRELTIEALVGLLIQVSVGAHRSIHAAYKADQASDDPQITVSAAAIYGKLGRLPPTLTEEVVRYSAQRCLRLVERNRPTRDEPLPGYCTRVLDGNALAGTHHRLTPLRRWLNTCLPGKSLVVYEPGVGLVTDVVLCADAYTQERLLLAHIVPRVAAKDLLIADRNFCTTKFVFGVHRRDAFVIVRQHRNSLPTTATGELITRGATDTGGVSEQPVQVRDEETGQVLPLRRIELDLVHETRDGDRKLALLSNLPAEVSAQAIAQLYRTRWAIESHFQFLTQELNCEWPSLGQPAAALFGFAMALVASNALAVVRSSIRAAHGPKAESELSGYYLADEIGHDYRTLMKYLPPDRWVGWPALSDQNLSRLLVAIAQRVNLKALTKSTRGPKKPPKEKPVYSKKRPHFSTHRLLNNLEPDDPC